MGGKEGGSCKRELQSESMAESEKEVDRGEVEQRVGGAGNEHCQGWWNQVVVGVRGRVV